MRALVTGGAGFIGSHLCEFFLGKGWEVVCMDDFVTGSRDNLAAVESRHGFTLIEHDVTEYIRLDGHLDWVLHFASPASPLDYLELPIQTLKVGALGTHNALGVAKAKGARAIPAFMGQALTGAPITVFGDGAQTRSFQYITDLIEGLWRLMQAPVNDPINIGNPQEMTLLGLAKRIIRLTGSRSEIVFR